MRREYVREREKVLESELDFIHPSIQLYTPKQAFIKLVYSCCHHLKFSKVLFNFAIWQFDIDNKSSMLNVRIISSE